VCSDWNLALCGTLTEATREVFAEYAASTYNEALLEEERWRQQFPKTREEWKVEKLLQVYLIYDKEEATKPY